MRYLLITATALVFAVFASGCNEDFEDAKFRCKINGKDFIPNKDLIDFQYTENSGNDHIRIRGTALSTGIIGNYPYGDLR
jgi:hypothetical protein